MRKPFIFTCLLILLSCNNQHRAKGVDISNEDKINIDTTLYLTESESVEDTTNAFHIEQETLEVHAHNYH